MVMSIPLACFADSPIRPHIEGGVFQDFAQAPHHLRGVLAPLLRRFCDGWVSRSTSRSSARDTCREVQEFFQITVMPTGRGLIGVTLVDPARCALCTALPSPVVSPNAASASGWSRRARRHLEQPNLACNIEHMHDMQARHPGANLTIWAESPGVRCAIR
jgi:hypothetical protein